jgi:gluconolactonase
MARTIPLAFILILATSEVIWAQTERIPAPVEFARLPTYTEGPVFGLDGNLYVSHGRFITRLAPNGVAAVWAETGGPNGHKVLEDGTHLVCDRTHHAVIHLAVDGELLGMAASQCGGQPVRAPNDLTLAPDGGFYFTDPGPYAEALEQPIGRVCFVDAAGNSYLVADELHFPNGIVLRPDGNTLLVAEDASNRILEYPVLSPGEVGRARVFAELPMKEGAAPDGLALDDQGNLYVAHYGAGLVLVLDPTGRLKYELPAGNISVSNLVFGGEDNNELFITGGSGGFDEPGFVYRLELE